MLSLCAPCCSQTCQTVPFTFLIHYIIKIVFSVVAEKSLHCLGQINLIIIIPSWKPLENHSRAVLTFSIFVHISGVLETDFLALLWLLWQVTAYLAHPWEIKEYRMGIKPKITPNNVQYGRIHPEQGEWEGNLAMVNPWPTAISPLWGPGGIVVTVQEEDASLPRRNMPDIREG